MQLKRAKDIDEVLFKIANPPRNKNGDVVFDYSPKDDYERGIVIMLKDEGLIIIKPGNHMCCEITENGTELLSAGGYTSIVNSVIDEQTEIKNRNKEEQRLNIKKLRREKYLAPLAIGVSILSLLISFVSLMRSCH